MQVMQKVMHRRFLTVPLGSIGQLLTVTVDLVF